MDTDMAVPSHILQYVRAKRTPYISNMTADKPMFVTFANCVLVGLLAVTTIRYTSDQAVVVCTSNYVFQMIACYEVTTNMATDKYPR